MSEDVSALRSGSFKFLRTFWKTHRRAAARLYTNADIKRKRIEPSSGGGLEHTYVGVVVA